MAKEARAVAVAQGGGQQWGSSLVPPPSRGGKRNLREGASRDPLAPCAAGLRLHPDGAEWHGNASGHGTRPRDQWEEMGLVQVWEHRDSPW